MGEHCEELAPTLFLFSFEVLCILLPCASSMIVSSSLLTSSPRVSSIEDPRLPRSCKLLCQHISRLAGCSTQSGCGSIGKHALVVSEDRRLWDTPGICGMATAGCGKCKKAAEEETAALEVENALATGSRGSAVAINRLSGDARK